MQEVGDAVGQAELHHRKLARQKNFLGGLKEYQNDGDCHVIGWVSWFKLLLPDYDGGLWMFVSLTNHR